MSLKVDKSRPPSPEAGASTQPLPASSASSTSSRTFTSSPPESPSASSVADFARAAFPEAPAAAPFPGAHLGTQKKRKVVKEKLSNEQVLDIILKKAHKDDVPKPIHPFFDELLLAYKFEKIPETFWFSNWEERTRLPQAPFTYTVAAHPGNCLLMQDRHLATRIKVVIDGEEYPIPLLAVFDGHGHEYGDAITDWVKENLPDNLVRQLSSCKELSKTEIEKAIFHAVITTNENLKGETGSDVAGCTAAVALLIKGDLWTFGVGDSRIIKVSKGKHQTLTYDARPDIPFFAKYLKKCGATIVKNKMGMSVVEGDDGRRLNMATSFGDFRVKHGCMPTITCTPAPTKDEFLLLASDGIWDIFSSETMAKVMATKGHTPSAKDLVHMTYQTAVKYCTDKGQTIKPGLIDNMILIVADFSEELAPSASSEPVPAPAEVEESDLPASPRPLLLSEGLFEEPKDDLLASPRAGGSVTPPVDNSLEA